MDTCQFESPISYKERIVVFFDVMGWEAHIKNASNNNDRITKLGNLLKLIKHLENIHAAAGELGSEITSFSDCCVISIPYQEELLPHILYNLCNTFVGATLMGFLLRAGVTIGKIYHENNLVFGPAMNRAHKLESSGRYPRIMLDPDIELLNCIDIPSMTSKDKHGTFVDPYQMSFIRSEYFNNPLQEDVLLGITTDKSVSIFTMLLLSLEEILQKTIDDEDSLEKHIEQANWAYARVRRQHKQILNL